MRPGCRIELRRKPEGPGSDRADSVRRFGAYRRMHADRMAPPTTEPAAANEDAAPRGSRLMPILLRLAALLSGSWAVVLVWPAAAPPDLHAPTARAVAHMAAIGHLGLVLLFLRAAANPSAERSAIYVALLVFGLRAASGTYQVLYCLDGVAALASLIDMALSLALFVGITNTLADALRE